MSLKLLRTDIFNGHRYGYVVLPDGTTLETKGSLTATDDELVTRAQAHWDSRPVDQPPSEPGVTLASVPTAELKAEVARRKLTATDMGFTTREIL